MTYFIRVCEEGDLKKAKEIFEGGNVDIHYGNERAFCSACCYGHLHIAKWLLEISATTLSASSVNDPLLRSEIINIHAYERAFRYACKNGHLHITKWLLEINATTLSASEAKDRRSSAEKKLICGSSAITSQADSDPLRELGTINIHVNNEEFFRWTCYYGHLEVAKLLIETSKKQNNLINIHAENDQAFYYAHKYYPHIARWLLTLYSYKELKNLNYSLAEKEFENRKKINIELILYLFKRKFKLLDIRAIAIIWREYI